jgi:hypothetical protein
MEHDAHTPVVMLELRSRAAAEEDADGPPLAAAGGLLADAGHDEGTDLAGTLRAAFAERFGVAFAEHCTVAGRAGNSKLRVTVAELADLAENMFVAGIHATLDELGY